MASPISPDAEPLLGATGVGGEVRNSHSGSGTAHESDPVRIGLGNEARVCIGITTDERADTLSDHQSGPANSTASAAEPTDWAGLRSWFGGLETAGRPLREGSLSQVGAKSAGEVGLLRRPGRLLTIRLRRRWRPSVPGSAWSRLALLMWGLWVHCERTPGPHRRVWGSGALGVDRRRDVEAQVMGQGGADAAAQARISKVSHRGAADPPSGDRP